MPVIFSHEMLHAARLRAGLTQERMARMADVSVNVVREVEHGRQEPKANTLVRLADAAGVSVNSLFIVVDGNGVDGSAAPPARTDIPEPLGGRAA